MGTIFQIWRRAPGDVIVFGLATLLLMANATVMSNMGFSEHPVLRPSIGVPLVTLSSLALYVFPIHSKVATIVFLIIGPIAMVFMWTKDAQFTSKPGRSITMSARIWANLFLIGCVWELGSYILSARAQNDNAYPTISILLGPLLKTSGGKGVFLLIWIGIGMQLLRLWRKK
jgi:hypothetical protein